MRWLLAFISLFSAIANACPFELLKARRIPDAHLRRIEIQYEKGKIKWAKEPITDLGTVNTIYADRINEPVASGLLKLGCALVTRNRRQSLELPENFRDIFAAFNTALAENHLDPKDELRPALIFINRKDPSKYLFIRPDIDPWPDGRSWIYDIEGKQLPHQVFYQAVAEGKVPTTLGGLLSHDLAHLAELIQSPTIMKGWRDYARLLAEHPEISTQTHRHKSYSLTEHSPSDLRSFVLAEFLSVPDIKKSDEILKLFGRRPSDQKHIEDIIQQAPDLLLRHGGGLADAHNFETRMVQSATSRLALINFKRKVTKFPFDPAPEQAIPFETLHGQVEYLSALYDLRYSPSRREARLKEIAKGRYGFDSGLVRTFNETDVKERNQILDDKIDATTNKLKNAFLAAVQFGITPDQIHKDARLQAPAHETPTYKYFKAYLRPRGL